MALLGGITLVGGLLRTWSPGRIALWGDEVQLLNIAALPSQREIVHFLLRHESHPPLLYSLVHLIGGSREHAAAVASFAILLVSIMAIPAAAWLAGMSHVRGGGSGAGLLVAMSLPLTFLSVQIRPYALLSLLLLLSVGALIRAATQARFAWKLAWAVTALVMLYLHHLAVLVLVMEVALGLALNAKRSGARTAIAQWAPWIALVALLALPDLALLFYQEAHTGYLPSVHQSGFLPARQLLRLMVSFPGELLLPGIVVAWLTPWSIRWWRSGRLEDTGACVLAGLHAAVLLLGLLLIAAAYRQNILVDHVVLALAPLGLALVGVSLAWLLHRTRRVAGVVIVEAAVVCVTLSALATVGAVKTNIDLVARTIAAEARADDLVLLAAGAPGASLNWYLDRRLSQIDYPIMGAVEMYPFDSGFARLADTVPVRQTAESLSAAASESRRVWFIYPSGWDVASQAPLVLADTLRGFAAVRARAALLHGLLTARFGEPSVSYPAAETPWSMEVMDLERYDGLAPHPGTAGGT